MSNNESKRPFADQVLEYAGIQVGDIWLDKQYAEVIKVLYIRDTDDAHPILVTGEDHINTFINESYFSDNCTLVERGGQVVVKESNLILNLGGCVDVMEIVHSEGDMYMVATHDTSRSVPSHRVIHKSHVGTKYKYYNP